MEKQDTQKEKVLRLKGKTLVAVDWANVYGWHTSLGWEVDTEKLFKYMNSYPEVFEQRFYHGVEKGKPWSCKIKDDAEKAGFKIVTKDVKWVPVLLEKSHFKEVVKELFDVLDSIQNTNSDISTRLYELRERVEERLSAREPDFDSDGGVQGEYPPYAPEDEKIYNSTYDLIEGLDAELKKLNINIEDLQKNLTTPIKRRKCDFDVEITKDVLNKINDFDTLLLFSGDGDYAALVEDLIKKDKSVIVVFASGHKGKEYDEIGKGIFLCPVKKFKKDIAKQENDGDED